MKVRLSLNLHWPISSAAPSLILRPFLTATSKLDRGQRKEICYRAFQKHANPEVQKPPSQLRLSLPSIIITITSNEPWNTEIDKTDRNPPITNHQSPITNHKPWPFELVEENFCFLRGPLLLTAAKNANVSWLLNFRISRVYEKRSKTEESTLEQWLALSVSVWQFINMLNKIVATLLKLFSGFKTGTMHLSAPFIKITLFELEAYHFK